MEKNKELTPMQELINDLQDNEPKYYERNYNYLHNLLEKEKQVIDKLISLLMQTTEYEVLESFREKVNKFKND